MAALTTIEPRRDDRPHSPAFARPLSSGADDRVFTAVRRLAKAVSAHLLAFDRLDERLTVIDGTHDDVAGLTGPAILAAVEPDTALMFGVAQPRWIATSDGGASLIVKLTERGATSLFLALGFDDATAIPRARVTRITPDLVTLLKAQLDLATRLDEVEGERAAAMSALDHDACGVITVRPDHSVVSANAAAADLLAGGHGLQVRRGVLRPTHQADVARFQVALDTVADAAPAPLGERRTGVLLLLTPDRNRPPVLVVITPVTGDARQRSDRPAAGAIVRVLPSGPAQAGTGSEALCRLHGLSRVETRLVEHLCAGLTVSEAAVAMHVQAETARAYLKQGFAKTGTHRQTELVALISNYLRAVRGDFDFQAG